MLNLITPENLDVINELCTLSVAAFDIESVTIQSDHVHADEYFPVNEMGSIGTETYTNKVQKPIMISHCDALSEREGGSIFNSYF